MAIDTELYQSPATRADAGRVAIKTSLALDAIARALELVAEGRAIEDQLDVIHQMSREIAEHWNSLAGWTRE